MILLMMHPLPAGVAVALPAAFGLEDYHPWLRRHLLIVRVTLVGRYPTATRYTITGLLVALSL